MRCINCGKKFDINLINVYKGLYCSLECRKISIDKKKKEMYNNIVDEKLNLRGE